ncbi:MAG: hypothetical protein ACRDOI_24545 [Trebonia sp.]
MPGNKSRGSRPTSSKGSFAASEPRVNHDNETPKFCLHFVADGFDVHALAAGQQVSFAKTLQKLSSSTWKDLKLASRHGQGTELIPRDQVRASIPAQFQDEPRFMVLWIEPGFGQLYAHA